MTILTRINNDTNGNPRLKSYMVLYRNNLLTELEAPFGFACSADDLEHAEDQCLNAEPDADVVWVIESVSYWDAIDDYYLS